MGGGKKRRRRLVLHGYVAQQEASYFALPITRDLELWGVDRQLGRMDFRQRSFFQKVRKRNPEAGLLYVAADPASAYGEPNEPGAALLRACKLSFEKDPMLYMAGDFHHYERRAFGPSTQIIAGGGGAFLHGTRINDSPSGPSECAYPSQAVSRKLAWGVPGRLLIGQGGYLIHAAGVVIAMLMLSAMERGLAAFYATAAVVTSALIVGLYFIAGHGRSHPRQAFLVSIPFGLLLGLLPTFLAMNLPPLVPWLTARTLVLVASAFASALLYGFFLLTAAMLGLEHQQAFTVLGHPGFKHFVRLRIEPDGTVEGFVFGKDDPLLPGPPSLIDRFTWRAKRAASSQAP